jgi:hypothetical protein
MQSCARQSSVWAEAAKVPAAKPLESRWREHHELAGIGPLDDFDLDLAAALLQTFLEFRPLIAAIGIALHNQLDTGEDVASALIKTPHRSVSRNSIRRFFA